MQDVRICNNLLYPIQFCLENASRALVLKRLDNILPCDYDSVYYSNNNDSLHTHENIVRFMTIGT